MKIMLLQRCVDTDQHIHDEYLKDHRWLPSLWQLAFIYYHGRPQRQCIIFIFFYGHSNKCHGYLT